MDSLPGGGAKIFSRPSPPHHLRPQNHRRPVAGSSRTAHRLSLNSNCTMLYGHIETEEDRVDHLVKLRALQDETQGFVTFIPLAFHPSNTAMEHISTTTGFEDLRQIAVSRLMLDNIPHHKAYWIVMTPRVAQIAQRFGSDDIDGTVVEEKNLPRRGSDDVPKPPPSRTPPPDQRIRPRPSRARHAIPPSPASRKRLHRFGLSKHIFRIRDRRRSKGGDRRSLFYQPFCPKAAIQRKATLCPSQPHAPFP